jgi:hypothetical protein
MSPASLPSVALCVLSSNICTIVGEAPHLFFWTNLELQIALICASIPACKVFLKHYKDSTFASKLTNSYSMGRFRSNASKSANSHRGLPMPGFYTQAISSDSKVAIKGIRVTTELHNAEETV